MSIDTPANPPVDAFEAALAVTEVAPVVEEVIAPVIEDVTDESVSEEYDENAEFRAALRNAPGEWFVVHSYAGYEKKVKGNLVNRIQSLNMEDFIFQIEVPEEEVRELKNGAIKVVKRDGVSGYVFFVLEVFFVVL
jgi:transcription termination/antitermination protein NusG